MIENLDALLNYDPLADAETHTGKSYKEDDNTIALGMTLQAVNSRHKEEALMAVGDNHYGMPYADQVQLYLDNGFQNVYHTTFAGRNVEESYDILWNSELGILATCESYDGFRMNTTKMYYNWVPSNMDNYWSYTSSGGFTEVSGGTLVWVGNHDTREGLLYRIKGLKDNGTLLPVWIERPFLWLLTYLDTDGEYDYDAINESRIAEFPLSVRSAITPTKE